MGVFFTMFGLGMAIFHRPPGRVAGYFQREVMKVKFAGDAPAAIGYLVVGILLTALGVMMWFGG